MYIYGNSKQTKQTGGKITKKKQPKTNVTKMDLRLGKYRPSGCSKCDVLW